MLKTMFLLVQLHNNANVDSLLSWNLCVLSDELLVSYKQPHIV